MHRRNHNRSQKESSSNDNNRRRRVQRIGVRLLPTSSTSASTAEAHRRNAARRYNVPVTSASSSDENDSYVDDDDSSIDYYNDDDSYDKEMNGRRRSITYCRQMKICQATSKLFIFALILFVGSQVYVAYLAFEIDEDRNNVSHRDKMQQPLRQKSPSPRPGAGSKLGTIAQFFDKRETRKNAEELAHGCVYTDWQTRNYPACNSMHEFYLPETLTNDTFLDHGLWRSVYSVMGMDEKPVAVMKTIRREHDVNARNLDRHRRDALTMEVLTGHPNVVSIYGYCGNSVLTEFAGGNLHKFIYPPGRDKKTSKWKPLHSEMINTVNPAPVMRLSFSEKNDLALDVALGMEALHTLNGPVAHADIQAKQFLVDDETKRIKINDFNRCRFMPANRNPGHDGEFCTFKIPSAPGLFRSPEEYKKKDLTEQIDIYSMAHIFYGESDIHESNTM